MNFQPVAFDKTKSLFVKTLKKRVDDYFKTNKISRYANFIMYFKSISLITLYFGSYATLYFFNESFLSLVLWFMMGIGMSGIGMSVMHDANHGAYSKNKNINNFKFYKLDINKDLNKICTLIKKQKPEYIINFAAQGMVNESWDKPEDWYNTNIVAQTKLYKILKGKFLKKIIHVTTPEVYGDKSSIINEEASFNPSTPYAISRMALDFHLKLYFANP